MAFKSSDGLWLKWLWNIWNASWYLEICKWYYFRRNQLKSKCFLELRSKRVGNTKCKAIQVISFQCQRAIFLIRSGRIGQFLNCDRLCCGFKRMINAKYILIQNIWNSPQSLAIPANIMSSGYSENIHQISSSIPLWFAHQVNPSTYRALFSLLSRKPLLTQWHTISISPLFRAYLDFSRKSKFIFLLAKYW